MVAKQILYDYRLRDTHAIWKAVFITSYKAVLTHSSTHLSPLQNLFGVVWLSLTGD